MGDAAQYLYGGLTGFGQQIGAAMERRAEEQKKREEEQKDEARRFKSLVEYADAAGLMPKDASITKSLPELEGLLKGKIYQRDAQEFQMRQKVRAAQLARYARQAQDDEALTGFADDFSKFSKPYEPGSGTAPLRGYSLPEAANLALERNPRAFGNPQLDNTLASFARLQPKPEAEPFSPTLTTQTVTLRDGTVVEMPVGLNSRGGAQFFPQFSPGNPMYADRSKPKADAAAKPIPRTELNAAIKDVETQLKSLDTQAARVARVGNRAEGERVAALKQRLAQLYAERDARNGLAAPSPAPAAPAAKSIRYKMDASGNFVRE